MLPLLLLISWISNSSGLSATLRGPDTAASTQHHQQPQPLQQQQQQQLFRRHGHCPDENRFELFIRELTDGSEVIVVIELFIGTSSMHAGEGANPHLLLKNDSSFE